MRGLYKRLRWASEILDYASKDSEALAQTTDHAISVFIRNRKTQIDSARAILNEIINEREQQKNEPTTSHGK